MGVKDLDSWWSPLPRTVGVTHKPRITKSGTPVCQRAREKLCQMYSDGIFVEEECFLSQEQGAGGLLLSLSIIRPL